jgi:DNA repair protein RadA/Sms
MTIQIQQQVKRGKGRPSTKNATYVPSIIDFNKVTKLNNIDIDPKMMESMSSGIGNMDKFFSHEGGVPCASNIMVAGSPGVGKTTVLLDVLSGITNKGRKTLFISAEMGQKQMFKYTQRFPQFGNVTTLFISDYLEYNTKDIIEQILNQGFDCVLIDSVAEIIDGVREDNNWDRKMAESWLVEVCVNNNQGKNELNKYTSFLLIQQMTKGQDMVGSNKLKHLTDAALFLRRESERDGGGTYMEFEKNRNGNADRMTYDLGNSSIKYGSISQRVEA